MNLNSLILLSLVLISCNSKQDPTKPVFINGKNLQVIEVVVDKMSDIKGTMYLYERDVIKGPLKFIDSFPIIIGKNGLAFDSTDINNKDQTKKVKKEGDGCAPAGVFSLGKVFSYHPLINLKMPFEQVDENDLCVDDVNSTYYNTLIDDDTIQIKDYTSFERMQRTDDQYEYGVWVNYNTDPQVAGNGSCIFLHIWKDADSGTSGCTAMSKENMMKLIEWLDETKSPILYQYAKAVNNIDNAYDQN